jgi:hypothetical protein
MEGKSLSSLELYGKNLPAGCTIMADESLEIPSWMDRDNVVRVPVLKAAGEQVGKSFTANVVAVGAINQLLGIVSEEGLKEALERHIPRGKEKSNHLAQRVGNGHPSGRRGGRSVCLPADSQLSLAKIRSTRYKKRNLDLKYLSIIPRPCAAVFAGCGRSNGFISSSERRGAFPHFSILP